MQIVSSDSDGVTSRTESRVRQHSVKPDSERRLGRMASSEKNASLTRRQHEIYEYLKDKIQNRGYGPTVREIGTHFRIRSPNGVMCHLKALEKKGLILRESNMSRAIGLTEGSKESLSLPLIGTAVAENPLRASVSSDERVEFNDLFRGENKACLNIQGSAFNTLGICDGDCIIVDRGAPGEPGNLVAALDNQHCVTLCRIQRDGKQPAPAIPGADPGPTRQILGVVVSVIRNCVKPMPDEHDANTNTTNNDE
ncbi:MAG: repressor LexA [Fuerstiella sp.]|nr:repressor LexA [Fuerstiella sp.]MCP4858789.1 repressor LexA [Fuerstiella sp.]